jgi:hypothetical protein
MNVVTIAGEYGSGSAELKGLVVLTLGWKLRDGQLVGAWSGSWTGTGNSNASRRAG